MSAFRRPPAPPNSAQLASQLGATREPHVMSILQTELLAFVAQNKKRNSEIRQSAEKSLGYLETLDSLADLSPLKEHPDFSTPFILACTSSNAKSCASALQCLQVLISLQGLSNERLEDVLDALFEAIHLGVAIQLKVLQLLPLLLSKHMDALCGPLLAKALQVCAELGRDHKASMVSNTAYATLQQLITSVFDNLDREEGENELVINTKVFQVNNTVYDAGRILLDLCDIAEAQKPRFLLFKSLPTAFTLELFELTLTNHSSVFSQPVFRTLLSQRIVPLLLRMFSEAANEFAYVVRVARLFYLLIRKHLTTIAVEAEVILNTLAQNCKAQSLWKQVLCLEVYQGVLSDSGLVLQIFSQYRRKSSSTLQDAIECFSAALVKSSVPMAISEPTPQISKAQNPKVPCIDQLDKTEPPEFSPSYFYYLVMVCINSISDGIAKLSAASRNSPKDTEKVAELLEQIDVPLTNCFAALVGGSMDLELFKGLVKSVQRSAHACGIHGLAAQRDNYIRILAQHSYLPEDPEVRARLLPRSIFCVRALFNLGYALGNKLRDSWTLIVECVDALASQIGGEFPWGDEYAPIEASLKRMLDQTSDLEDDALVYIVKALLERPQQLNFELAVHLVRANADRFFGAFFWDPFSDRLLEIAAGVQDESSALRLGATRALDASALATMDMAESDDAFKRIINTLFRQVQLPSPEIQLSAVSTLNSLLDQFSSKFSSGWEHVFEIFSYVSQSETQPELYKTTFEALEFVCRDFLAELPYECVYDLVLCLDQFSRQHLDLNTSFTATSLFWPVCDYIIKCGQDDEDEEDGEASAGSSGKGSASEAQALSTATSATLPSLARKSPLALYLCAQIKLAHIADDPQHQIKTGAIHIFFRLFEAHYKQLPDQVWAKCLELVFPEIMKVGGGDNPQETFGLVINGLGAIYSANITRSVDALGPVLDYFGECGPATLGTALAQLEAFVQVIDKAECQASKELRQKMWDFWAAQSPALEPSRKNTDALMALVRLLPRLDAFVGPNSAQVAGAAHALVQVAHSPNRYGSLSELQQVVLGAFEELWGRHSELPERKQLLEEVSELCVYCFGDVATAEYTALSLKSQQLCLAWLREFGGKMDTLGLVLERIVMVLEFAPERQVAIDLFLHVAGGLDDLAALAPTLAKGGVLLVNGGAAGDSECDAIDAFIAILERHTDSATAIWPEFIHAVAVNSLLYERGYLSPRLFDSEVPEEIFGSIEDEVPAQRPDVAYHCLEILQRLEQGAALWRKRVELVLKQTVGDARLRGREPMSALLERELLFILGQLSARRDASLDPLLLRCISVNDRPVRQIIENILVN